MDMESITKLIPLCASSRVKSIKYDGLEIVFHVEPEPRGQSTDKIVEAMRAQEQQLPPDLRTDAISSYDAILNWSGSPDPSKEAEIPLTGDQPL